MAFGRVEGGRAWDLGSSANKGEPHTSMEVVEEHRAGEEHVTPTSGPKGTCPFLNTATEVRKAKPNFIYTRPKAHDLGLEDRSQGRGGWATEDSDRVQKEGTPRDGWAPL